MRGVLGDGPTPIEQGDSAVKEEPQLYVEWNVDDVE